jgi:hypothetical protein
VKPKKKLNRKELKAEERKKKRLIKAEAKRTRRANATPASKWTDEKKNAMKDKKQAKLAAQADMPEKLQKHKARLLKRQEKLKLQAQKLLTEAAKAAAQYERLVEQEVCSSTECLPSSNWYN